MAKKKIAVVFGGVSPEHEVSVDSARTICANMDPDRWEPVPLYVDRKGSWFLCSKRKFSGAKRVVKEKEIFVKPGRDCFFSGESAAEKVKADAVFPIIHGYGGEDGALQGFLESLDLPYVGANVFSSALCMDKDASKTLAEKIGVPCLKHRVLKKHDAPDISGSGIEYPVFVKPAGSGSSVGVSKARGEKDLREAVSNAFKYGERVMVEEGVEKAREIVCGVLDDGLATRVSVCGLVRPRGDFFDYRTKYLDTDGFDFSAPAPISAEAAGALRKASLELFSAFKIDSMARVDFLMEENSEKFYFCEVNTLPGFTSHSLYPLLWRRSGIGVENLITALLNSAFAAHRRKRELKTRLAGFTELQ